PNVSTGAPDPTKQTTKLVFQTDLRGGPQGTAGKDVPWASLDSAVNTTGEVLAPGYVLDLPDRGSSSLTFTAQTYPWLARLRVEDPVAFQKLLDPKKLAFRFHILAAATVLTRAEFVAQQTAQAQHLRDQILADSTASKALVALATDSTTWVNLYLSALEQAGLLLPEGSAPPIHTTPPMVSLMATLASGLLLGPAGKEITRSGNLVDFFAAVRKWYGNDNTLVGQPLPPDGQLYDLGLSHPTHFQAFNVYVPLAEFLNNLPDDDGGGLT